VTPRPQPGNPRPRLFRLPQDRALINRLGFPGRGAEFLAARLRGPRPDGLVLGVNLGKNAFTPLDAAVQDYLSLLDVFAPLTDYLAVNVSSPNTVGLRRLQARAALDSLLAALVERRAALRDSKHLHLPILVKLSPDLSSAELDDALTAILDQGVDGVIAANTTLSRGSLASEHAAETGGLSGAPLRAGNTAMVAEIHRRTAGKLPIVGVGGVMDAADAREMLQAGATLVQIYTGLVYTGPGLVKAILTDL